MVEIEGEGEWGYGESKDSVGFIDAAKIHCLSIIATASASRVGRY